MRVLILNSSLRAAGKERRLLQFLTGLKEYTDIEMGLVLVNRHVDFHTVFDLKIPIYFLERKARYDPSLSLRLFSVGRRFAPDLIHSWSYMTSIYALPMRMAGYPLINSMIAEVPEPLKVGSKLWWAKSLTFPFSNIITSNSEAGLQAYAAPRNRSQVIYNGFDWSRLNGLASSVTVRAELNISTQFVVGMVARFESAKDYGTLARAAQILISSGVDVTFILVGDGPMRDGVEALVHPEHRPRIRFLGQRSDVEALIGAFDIGVLSTHGEGISNSVLEYMALGKPVVVSDGGGTKELVLHGQTGLIVPRGSPARLAGAIRYLLRRPEVREKMGQAGLARVQNAFRLDTMVRSFVELYRRLALGTAEGYEDRAGR